VSRVIPPSRVAPCVQQGGPVCPGWPLCPPGFTMDPAEARQHYKVHVAPSEGSVAHMTPYPRVTPPGCRSNTHTVLMVDELLLRFIARCNFVCAPWVDPG